jgi:hypothetical protein
LRLLLLQEELGLLRDELRLKLLLLVLLQSLELQHLHHLHLQRRVRGLHELNGLNGLAGQERRRKRSNIGIHAALLLLSESVVWPIDSGSHGHTRCLVVGKHGLGRHFEDLIVLFLGEDGGMELRSEARNIERATRGSGVWHRC